MWNKSDSSKGIFFNTLESKTVLGLAWSFAYIFSHFWNILTFLQTLQHLVACLLLTGHAAHLKTHDVLKYMFMNLILNIKKWFLKKIFDVVLLWVTLGAILASEVSKILEHWAYILRFGSHLLKKLYYCFHEVLRLLENFGSSLIKFILILRVMKSAALLHFSILLTLCCRLGLLIFRLERLHLCFGSGCFSIFRLVCNLLTGGMMYVIITTGRYVYTHLIIVLLLIIAFALRRLCFSRCFWSTQSCINASDQLVDVSLLTRSGREVLLQKVEAFGSDGVGGHHHVCGEVRRAVLCVSGISAWSVITLFLLLSFLQEKAFLIIKAWPLMLAVLCLCGWWRLHLDVLILDWKWLDEVHYVLDYLSLFFQDIWIMNLFVVRPIILYYLIRWLSIQIIAFEDLRLIDILLTNLTQTTIVLICGMF